jgi:hypothetical protein
MDVIVRLKTESCEKRIAQGYLCYVFFLPRLILDALERRDGFYLAA